MMTDDAKKIAAAVAAQLYLDEFHAEVLPDIRAGFARKEHVAGREVIMIGDDVNGAPALPGANVGVVILDSAVIACEVADVTITADNLRELASLRKFSIALIYRIHSNHGSIIGLNALFIALGVGGVSPPVTGAPLRNGSTIVIGLESMTSLLDEKENAQGEVLRNRGSMKGVRRATGECYPADSFVEGRACFKAVFMHPRETHDIPR